ncbi:MAG TPA: hypothetical protein DEQ09_13265 [Bacteroidales bacterium]|nr:hypothetical protein [Bacteroidales bacterium]
MKKYFLASRAIITLLIISMVMFNSSCKKKDKGDEKPDLPPQESLLMDFSDFDERPDTKGTTYNNFVYSFLNVAFWNTVTTSSLAFPALAYVNMVGQNARYLGDNSWEWAYYFTYEQTDYVATFTTSRINNETYSAEMMIAEEATPEAGFKWFDGVVRFDRTAASWNVYKDAASPVKVIEVDWTKNYEANTSSLTYTYVEPAQDETGSSITFGKDPSLAYNAWYTISFSSETIEIQWDMATKAGRVRNEDHFLDTDWHCWDASLVDIECPDL